MNADALRGGDMSQNHIGFQLRMLQNEVVRFIDQRARAEGLDEVTQSNGWILKTLYENQNRDIFQKDNETECGMARSTVTGVVKLMERKGLIRRESVSSDARLKKLVLTEKGISAHRTMYGIIQECEKALAADMTPEEQRWFLLQLRQMRENLG